MEDRETVSTCWKLAKKSCEGIAGEITALQTMVLVVLFREFRFFTVYRTESRHGEYQEKNQNLNFASNAPDYTEMCEVCAELCAPCLRTLGVVAFSYKGPNHTEMCEVFAELCVFSDIGSCSF